MKKCILLLLLLFTSFNTFAHYMWVETNPSGKVNKKQEVKVFFGEYTYGLQEKVAGDAFAKMKKFQVWVIAPNGDKTQLQMQPGDVFYSGWFEPKTNGTHTVVLDNNEIDVIDYTQYNFGIFKTHYHGVAKVDVGDKNTDTAAVNSDGLTVVDVSKTTHKKDGETTLKVLYKGQPIKDAEVAIYVADQWTKKLNTDANGIIKFALPWATKYVIEVTTKEEVPGKYNGKDYQFVWHCATYAIPFKN